MLRRLKWQWIRFVGRHGYFVIPEWRLNEGWLGLYLAKLFGTLKIDCVIDNGANEGQFHDLLREVVGFDGHIVSFEPNPDLVRTLRRRSKGDVKWHIHGVALGATEDTAGFHITQNDEFSSFLIPDDSVVSAFTQDNRIVRTQSVEMVTLDTVYPELQRQLRICRPYLKLDTQGYDLEVVKGAFVCLSAMTAVQTEAYVKPIYRDVPSFDTSIRLLREGGFELSAMFRASDGAFPLLVDVDCIMVNRRAIPFLAGVSE